MTTDIWQYSTHLSCLPKMIYHLYCVISTILAMNTKISMVPEDNMRLYSMDLFIFIYINYESIVSNQKKKKKGGGDKLALIISFSFKRDKFSLS